MPNNRLAGGAKVLRDQLLAKFPDSHWNGHGEPDGLNVIRSIEFGGEAANYLHHVLYDLDDERILDFYRDEDLVIVTFVPTRRADQNQPFPLDAAEVIADEREAAEKPVTKKAAAKPEPKSKDDE